MIGDLSQLSDIVSRKKISDRRLRNEQIRQGFQDSGQFSLENQQQIQQAQQPSEFWGAGRKEASVQAADREAANLVGGLHTLGGKNYYYGDKDTSTAQLGTKGYTLNDIGYGKSDILDSNNKSLGTYWTSVKDATNKIMQDKINSSLTWDADNQVWSSPYLSSVDADGVDMYGRYNNYSPSDYSGNAQTPTPEEQKQLLLQKLFSNIPTQYNRSAYGGGALEDWEVLGQALSTGQIPLPHTTPRRLAANNTPESIKGADSLYGSTPLIWNNELMGYKTDLGPGDPSVHGYKNPFAIARTDPDGSTISNYQNFRDIDLDAWRQVGKFTGKGEDIFIPKENIDKLPGWTNRDVGMYAHSNNSPYVGAIGTLLSIFGGPFAPIGYAINAGTAMDSGNYFGALSSLVAPTGAFDSLASGLSGMSGLSVPVSRAFVSGGMGGLGALSQGKDFLPAAIGSGLGSYAGEALGGLTKEALGEIGSKALAGAASGGLKSLFTKGDAVKGSLYGGMSGGLHGYLNSVSQNSDSFNKQNEMKNRELAQGVTKLARLFANRK